ncbi:YybH family protein [Rhodohalobacter sp. 614A]|uniref:YybH family protein n=1 Tax=Rhodohalobacter sp. 614A TaxID=2908649 RepID=UPI001F29A108|nr:DUF4440 domain-containing protein [Rhodohalobacter sp. 614A]
MKESLYIFFAFISLASLISCENDTNTPEDYDAVQASWETFGQNWNDLNAEGCMTIFFDDAIMIPPQLLELEGKPAIQEFYQDLFDMNQSAEYDHVTESINFSKEQAIEVGSFSIKWISTEGDSSTFWARSMIHWERDQYGDWKIKKLLFNHPPSSQASE